MGDDALADMQPTSPAAILERQLIKEGSLNFETSDITETRQHIESLVQKYKAYISQEDERTTASRIYQDITVRIPKAHFDLFLSELSGDIKKFDNKSVTVQDVTEEFVDITAQIKELCPETIFHGQVYVIDYTKTDNTKLRLYYISDGKMQNGQLVTENITVE